MALEKKYFDANLILFVFWQQVAGEKSVRGWGRIERGQNCTDGRKEMKECETEKYTVGQQ